jgi:hypothetical protein
MIGKMKNIIREHKFISALLLIAVVLTVCVLAADLSQNEEKMIAKENSIKKTIEERALQCYVIEDAYPESLDYLEKNYGLKINKEDYKIVYRPYAQNMPPEVRVFYKGG